MDIRQRQIEREATQRDAALGRRLGQLREGHLGPVIKRWVNADIKPIADIIRCAALCYDAGDMAGFAEALDSPSAELSTERPLSGLLAWCLRGRSPGRGLLKDTSHADDLVLAFMGAVITRCAVSGGDEPTVAGALSGAADALRDAVLGQFIVSIQGASAMQAIRERSPELWQQKKALNRICNQLATQVRPQLLEEERGERVLKTRGHKKVLSVIDQSGKERMISLRKPDAIDWEVMSLCYRSEADAGSSTHRSLWLGFAGVFLAAAQKAGGWFDVGEKRQRHGKHVRTSKLLLLSDRAHEAIKADADKWVSMGFDQEPMIMEPEDGDYLSVKHRKVNGQRAPLGMTTKPEETSAWRDGACALSGTPWTVNPHALITYGLEGAPSDVLLRLSAHKRLGTETTFYLPVTMDFRGRIYYRPTRVTPQSGDLGKSLLCFPLEGQPHGGKLLGSNDYSLHIDALAMHLTGLYGGPNKLDKAPLAPRLAWLSRLTDDTYEEVIAKADKPLTLRAHLELMKAGETDRIPIQLDGTCNGLQHLSAMFRDEEGAKHVNLCRSTLNEPPADIYGHVAGITERNTKWMTSCFGADVARTLSDRKARHGWLYRLKGTGIVFDRSLCKTPVMVLPYGGTREAVSRAVKASLLERLSSLGKDTPWHAHEEDGYGAFKDRELADHPLFNRDAGELAGLIWESIAPAIPRAMAAMGTLQAIGSWVGERGLSWRVGTGPEDKRLWVTQAKSKAERKQVSMKGFHLPAMVRRLTLNVGLNEIDPKAHRTGIVANFIHSQDAAHLAASVALFRERGGGCVGSVHDCVMVRPSEAALMGTCLRGAFVALYEEDPLSQPVRLIDPDGQYAEYENWHMLAFLAEGARQDNPKRQDEKPIVFPERGTFNIREVLDSAWFFS